MVRTPDQDNKLETDTVQNPELVNMKVGARVSGTWVGVLAEKDVAGNSTIIVLNFDVKSQQNRADKEFARLTGDNGVSPGGTDVEDDDGGPDVEDDDDDI